jgi:hypothetical protein
MVGAGEDGGGGGWCQWQVCEEPPPGRTSDATRWFSAVHTVRMGGRARMPPHIPLPPQPNPTTLMHPHLAGEGAVPERRHALVQRRPHRARGQLVIVRSLQLGGQRVALAEHLVGCQEERWDLDRRNGLQVRWIREVRALEVATPRPLPRPSPSRARHASCVGHVTDV